MDTQKGASLSFAVALREAFGVMLVLFGLMG